MKKKSFEEVKQLVLEQGKGDYIVNPPYVNSKTKMEFIHKVCGNHFMMNYNAFQGGQRCPKCSFKNRVKPRTKTQEQFIKEVDDCYGKGSYTVIGKYTTALSKVEVKHNACGNIYLTKPADFIRGHGCPKCAYEVRSSKVGVNQRTSFSEVKASIYSILGEDFIVTEPAGGYKGNRQKLSIKHSVCGHSFISRFADIQRYGHSCPICSAKSGPESTILTILEQEFGLVVDEDFYYAYVVPDLKYKAHLHFDFYFKESSVAIEYDGRQHYMPVSVYDGIEGFYAYQTRDALKTQYCVANKIMLFRIPYTITSYSDLKSILSEILTYVN